MAKSCQRALLVLVLAVPVARPQGPDDPAAAVTAGAIAAHVRFLSDDLLEGRGVGTRGDALSQAYIESQMRLAGLEPGAADKSYRQPVPLVGVTAKIRKPLTISKGSERRAFSAPVDFVAFAGGPSETSRWAGAEIVFVGYGITAPEERWDDFKGADLKGKVLLVMNNDPSSDPNLFGGVRRLYYGRWSYKYEEAARRGAAGAIVIHTEPSAGYPFQVIQSDHEHEKFELQGSAEPRIAVKAWCSEDAARAIAKMGGEDLDALRARAETRDFAPVPLGVMADLETANTVDRLSSANVLGILRGSDPKLRDECVVLTAHFDHLGIGPEKNGDRIYNGALDNASGVAMILTVARALGGAKERPRRSFLFAAVTGEESGLLGSQFLAANPPVPQAALVADLNVDGMNIWGKTSDITVTGLGKSTVDAAITDAAARQGRTVVPDQMPDRGYFYRSDQFSFAKVGVPAVFVQHGYRFVGKPEGFGKQVVEEWTRTHYHQPNDVMEPGWDLSGAVEDARVILAAAVTIANADAPPRWNPGDEFEKLRPGR